MKKSDLKTGMRTMDRDGVVSVVVLCENKNGLHDENGLYDSLDYYNDDLTNNSPNPGYDIVRVYSAPFNTKELVNPIHPLVLNVIWERGEETPEYTMEEAIEKMGHDFKIKK